MFLDEYLQKSSNITKHLWMIITIKIILPSPTEKQSAVMQQKQVEDVICTKKALYGDLNLAKMLLERKVAMTHEKGDYEQV